MNNQKLSDLNKTKYYKYDKKNHYANTYFKSPKNECQSW